MQKTRAYTEEEIADKIYVHFQRLAKYWANESRQSDPFDKCMGMAHSIFAMLGGATIDLPAFDLVPAPHEDDKEYCQHIGENWYPENVKVQVDGYQFYRALERLGFDKHSDNHFTG